jgi:5-methylcytosine-specific restriction endonuclease McrA
MKKKPCTPKSRIKNALRLLWLRSRERAARLKMDNYSCQECGCKQSRTAGKEVCVEVHHIHKIPDWEGITQIIYDNVLVPPEDLITLCKDCHKKMHENT